MDPVTPAPAAPAQPAAPVTVSATRDAATRGDLSAFERADAASRTGNPLPAVEVKPDAPAAPVTPAATTPAAPVTDPAAPPAEPTLSKRQQDANERTRRAVDAATADLRAEIERLKAGQPPAAPAATPTPAEPEWKRYSAHPDAPQLEDFDSVGEHAAAMALFVNRQMASEQTQATQQQQRDAFLRTRAQSFGENLRQASDADPDFASKIPPEVLTARPLSAMTPAERPTFANVVAEAAFRSDNPAAFLQYLHANPASVAEIAKLPSIDWALVALARLDGRISGAPAAPAATPPAAPAVPAAPVPSPISAAPPPPPTLSTNTSADPKAAALARGDFAAFDAIEQQERLAKRRQTA